MQVLAACVYTLGHYAYFHYYITNLKKKHATQKTHSNGKAPVNLRFVRRDSITELEDEFPFESVMDFLPAVIEDQVCLQLYFWYLCELLNCEISFIFIEKHDMVLLYHYYCVNTHCIYCQKFCKIEHTCQQPIICACLCNFTSVFCEHNHLSECIKRMNSTLLTFKCWLIRHLVIAIIDYHLHPQNSWRHWYKHP